MILAPLGWLYDWDDGNYQDPSGRPWWTIAGRDKWALDFWRLHGRVPWKRSKRPLRTRLMKITISIDVERKKPPAEAAPVVANQAQNAVPAAPSCVLPGQPDVGARWPQNGAHGYVYDSDAPYL